MFEKVLPGGTAQAIQTIGESGVLSAAYLAGGTAVALHLGHRVSRDLDFFTPESFDERELLPQIEALGISVEEMRWKTVLGNLAGVQFSLFYLPYPLLAEPTDYRHIHIAGLQDCAVMKFEAIGRRAARRDFIDLRAIMQSQNLSIDDLVRLHLEKYGDKHNTRIHNVRSLSYFAEADADDRPLELLMPIDWEDVKAFFRGEVETTSRKLLDGQ